VFARSGKVPEGRGREKKRKKRLEEAVAGRLRFALRGANGVARGSDGLVSRCPLGRRWLLGLRLQSGEAGPVVSRVGVRASVTQHTAARQDGTGAAGEGNEGGGNQNKKRKKGTREERDGPCACVLPVRWQTQVRAWRLRGRKSPVPCCRKLQWSAWLLAAADTGQWTGSGPWWLEVKSGELCAFIPAQSILRIRLRERGLVGLHVTGPLDR
jgi:hypothetical protein